MTITSGRSDHPELCGKTTLERWLIAMSVMYGVALVAALFVLLPGETSDEFPSKGQELAGAQSSSLWPQGGNARSSLAQDQGFPLPALGNPSVKNESSDFDPNRTRSELSTGVPDAGQSQAKPSFKASLAAPVEVTRCWTTDGTEMSRFDCDTPAFVSPWVDELYGAVDACRLSGRGESSRGVLLLGVEADLLRGRSSAWLEPGSTLESAADIALCLRNQMPAPPVGAIGDRVRYQLALSFVLPAPLPLPQPMTEDAAPANSLGLAFPAGELAAVTSEKVRVRKQPTENGEVIGKISPPAQVLVLERNEQWCRVITPNRNEGWMVCWALGPLPASP
ncbi:MAG: SH3 domain-containing protein [Myxococcota bacterium]|jgi:hypothetical protein|nr:SH3 domain-containing protein [Myxococcota bacterium]